MRGREIINLAERVGFTLNRAASCLFEAPGQEVEKYRSPREGSGKGAGFVAMRFAATNPD
jgi:hypothetical protein